MHGPTAMDLPNRGLVQDGTKCGDERICLHKQCTSFMELKRPPCPGEENNIPCSGNGVRRFTLIRKRTFLNASQPREKSTHTEFLPLPFCSLYVRDEMPSSREFM